MRSQTHKLVYYIGQEAGELYDLEADPHELTNLWDQPAYATTKQQLLNDLLAWFDSADALLPEKANPKYNAEAHRKADRSARGKN